MGAHDEARLDTKFIDFARQMNLYLNHFPKHEKYGLAQSIRTKAYEMYGYIIEAQKRYQKKTYARFRFLSTYANGSFLSLIPAYIRQWCMPSFLASCVAVSRSPWYSTHTCLRRLFCWVMWSAQRQFSGVYGPFGSILSRVVPSGLSFAQAANPSKVRHSSQTKTPFAPYSGYCLSLFSWQRLTMLYQPLYKCLFRLKAQSQKRFAAAFFIAADRTHPQDVTTPFCSEYDAAIFSPPQSQRQSHLARPLVSLALRLKTVSFPNFFPVRSTRFFDIFALSKSNCI